MTREDLLGYLLSALEPHEMRRIAEQLQEDPRLREELAEVERSLAPLDRAQAAEELVNVPPALVARTMERIPSRSRPVPREAVVTLRPAADAPPRGRRSLVDLAIASAAAGFLLALGLPMLARVRSEARTVACQDNLRQLGMALSQFVLRERNAYLPRLAESGPEAFAGVYAVRLADQGLLSEAQLRLCPEAGVALPEPPVPKNRSTLVSAGAPAALTHLVVGEELQQAASAGDVSTLRWLQQIAGGHYAYSLGVMDGDRYSAPQSEGRASFPILGDAPLSGTYVADTADVTKMRWCHGGNGTNLLFEDGSVRHMRMAAMLGMPDHPYINHRGLIEAGVNIDDASLAPSWRPPFAEARQR